MTSNFRRWAALVIVCFGQLMIMVDTTIVNVALPYMQRDLGFSPANLTWVVNAYLIAYGSFLLVAGRLGDLIGRRKVFLAGVFLFTVASIGCGFAQGADHLIVGRFLQGLGGSLSAGVIIAIIVTEFQKPVERAQAMSVFTLVIAGGGSLGLLAGGFLTQWVSWHWIFFINVPIGILTLVLGVWLIDENEGLGLSHGVDIPGAVLITAALMLGVYGIVTAADYGWTSAHTLGFGGASIALTAAFVLLESRLRNPLVPLRVFAIRSLTGATAARALLFSGLFTNFFVGALYLQQVHGYTAFETGLAFLPTTLMIGVMSAGLAARLMARIGPRNLLIAGLAIIVTALVILSTVGAETGYAPSLLSAYVLLGAGGGMSFLPLLTISMSEVPLADAGLGSGFSNVVMQVGGALGLASITSISTSSAEGTGTFQLAYVLAAIAVAAALAVTVAVLRSAPAVQPAHESVHLEEAAWAQGGNLRANGPGQPPPLGGVGGGQHRWRRCAPPQCPRCRPPVAGRGQEFHRGRGRSPASGRRCCRRCPSVPLLRLDASRRDDHLRAPRLHLGVHGEEPEGPVLPQLWSSRLAQDDGCDAAARVAGPALVCGRPVDRPGQFRQSPEARDTGRTRGRHRRSGRGRPRTQPFRAARLIRVRGNDRRRVRLLRAASRTRLTGRGSR